jgi:hypothetical protein
MVLAWALGGLLLVSVSGGCAGTQESDESVEPSSTAAEANYNNPGEEDAPVEEAGSFKTNTETQAGATESETTVSCGDPKLAAKYNECQAAKDEQSCVAAGGNWTKIGLSPTKLCQCYTGQEDCPCETSADCLSHCIASLDLSNWDCSAKRTCSKVAKTAGCWCRYHKDGGVRKVCMD